jgi:predicted O-linked N-acetylglucosamine transferase (SPINDLY family)
VLAREEEARTELETATNTGLELLRLRTAQLISPMPDSVEQIIQERDRFQQAIGELRNAIKPVSSIDNGYFVPNFYLAYHGLNDRPLQEAWTGLLSQICPSLRWAPMCRPERHNKERLAVAIISSHLKGHTIARLTAGLMQKLPRDRFEVVAWDLSSSNDTRPLEGMADRVERASPVIEQTAGMIAAAGTDIAFFPDIGMDPTTYRLAMCRLAPVQCTTWGHPVTTGLDSVDYYISSELIEPSDADSHYTEKLVRLKTLPVYYYRPRRQGREKPAFPSHWHVYLCPQTLFKFHPAFDDILAEILSRDPAGRLILIDHGGAYSNYANKLGDRFGVKYPALIDRLVFLNKMPVDDLLGLMQHCHAMLDTHPFGGGNTTYEALAMGAPVVTRPADFMRGRVTLGCYRKMDFEECVASTADEYVELTLRLGNDTDYREWVKSEILARCHSLYEDNAAVVEIADFLRSAYGQAVL